MRKRRPVWIATDLGRRCLLIGLLMLLFIPALRTGLSVPPVAAQTQAPHGATAAPRAAAVASTTSRATSSAGTARAATASAAASSPTAVASTPAGAATAPAAPLPHFLPAAVAIARAAAREAERTAAAASFGTGPGGPDTPPSQTVVGTPAQGATGPEKNNPTTDVEGGSTSALPVRNYTVAAGDNLSVIAQRFGTDVRSLEASNGLTDSSILQPGQRLVVPTEVGWVYTVASGDTLERIASLAGVSTSALAGANHITGNTILQIGERLWIPHEPPATVASTPVRQSHGSGSASASSGQGVIWPVHGPITSPFGWRWLFGRRDFHEGIDIGVRMYTHVHAAISGRVIMAGWDGPYGIAVRIQRGNMVTLYAHNSRVIVHVGQWVNQGQMISYSGMTGNATGPHVHFGIYINGQAVNPMNYLPH